MGRLHVWRQLLGRPVVVIVVAVWGAINAFSTLKGEILPVSWQGKIPRALDLFGAVPWWGWLIGWLTVLLGLTLEGSYRVISRLESEAGNGDTLSVDVDLPEVVIEPHTGFTFAITGHGLPSAIYATARNLRLTNRSKNRTVVLDISLVVKAGTDEEIYKRTLLSMPQQSPGLDVGPSIVLRSLGEEPLDPLVTIGPQNGDSGSIVFSLPYPGSQELDTEVARLRSCKFSLIVRDTLSGLDHRHSIGRIVVDA